MLCIPNTTIDTFSTQNQCCKLDQNGQNYVLGIDKNPKYYIEMKLSCLPVLVSRNRKMGFIKASWKNLFFIFLSYLIIFLKFRGSAFGVFHFEKSSNMAKKLRKTLFKLPSIHCSKDFLEPDFRLHTRIHHYLYI